MADRVLRVLLADDEPIARRGLERLLQREPGVDVIAACASGAEALAEIRTRKPDVALLDIAMPGMSGIQVMRALVSAERPAVIFITAFDEFAIAAFDLHAVDYLLKPFDEERFHIAFRRTRARLAAARDAARAAQLETVLEALERRAAGERRLTVKDGDRVLVVPADEIDWCEAQDNYVRLHAGGKRHLVRITLRAIEQQLDRHAFARIHRSVIVNLARVREVRPLRSGEYRVTLADGTKVTLSRTYRDAVLAALRK